MIRGALAALLALAAGGCLEADTLPYAEIRVEARDPGGAGVAGARVEAYNTTLSRPRAVDYTASSGSVRLRIPAETYELRVYAPDPSWTPEVAFDTVAFDTREPGAAVTRTFVFTPVP